MMADELSLLRALGWLREGPLRLPNGGYQSVYDPASGQCHSWGGGRTCLLTTAGSVLVFLTTGEHDRACESAEHLLSLSIRTPGRFAGAMQAGEGSRYVYPYYTGFAIRALLAAHRATGHQRYGDEALRAARWILAHAVQPDGSIGEMCVVGRPTLRERFLDTSPVWQAIFVAVFDQLETLTQDATFRRARQRLIAWLERRQRPDGSFPVCTRPWLHRLARTLYTRRMEMLTADEAVTHPTANVAAFEALMVTGQTDRAQRVCAWMNQHLSSHDLFYQYYAGAEHSGEEDIMPTAFWGLTLLAHPACGDFVPVGDICERIAQGLRYAQATSADAAIDGGVRGLPQHPTEGHKLYCWDTQYSVLFWHQFSQWQQRAARASHDQRAVIVGSRKGREGS